MVEYPAEMHQILSSSGRYILHDRMIKGEGVCGWRMQNPIRIQFADVQNGPLVAFCRYRLYTVILPSTLRVLRAVFSLRDEDVVDNNNNPNH